MLASLTKHRCVTPLCNSMLKKLQLPKLKISNSSKTRPDRKNLATILKSAPKNFFQNVLKLQSPRKAVL